MTFKAIAFAALVAVSTAASATTTDWGTLTGPMVSTGFATGAGSSIDDIFKFSLSSSSSVVAVAVTNDGAGGVFDLTGGNVSLYEVGNATALGSFNFDSTAISYNFSGLTAGNYCYEVKPLVAPTAAAGSYLLSSTLAPVHKPAS